MTDSALTVEFFRSMKRIKGDTWNNLAGAVSPFLRYEFLLALETSGCASRATGWQPYHVQIKRATSGSSQEAAIVAVMPLYLKTNSFGEYVFDWSWADAYQTYGAQYYPKFVTAIPFTPSMSSRILVSADITEAEAIELIVPAIQAKARELGVSSWHLLFPTAAESSLLESHAVMKRIACQFHWFNRGYDSFDQFLDTLTSRKRKNIRKERATVLEQKIEFEIVEGADIRQRHWEQFFIFYQSTYWTRGREGYLKSEFFQKISQKMPENLFLLFAKARGEAIAGALFFKDQDKLYGRYWGSLEQYQFLHFETCYYQGIEYCIRNRLKVFDAGAQGEHKLQRGFEPVVTYSNHWLQDPAFNSAIADFLTTEEEYVNRYITEAQKLLPYKASGIEQEAQKPVNSLTET